MCYKLVYLEDRTLQTGDEDNKFSQVTRVSRVYELSLNVRRNGFLIPPASKL